jgi:hypothetical protein
MKLRAWVKCNNAYNTLRAKLMYIHRRLTTALGQKALMKYYMNIASILFWFI